MKWKRCDIRRIYMANIPSDVAHNKSTRKHFLPSCLREINLFYFISTLLLLLFVCFSNWMRKYTCFYTKFNISIPLMLNRWILVNLHHYNYSIASLASALYMQCVCIICIVCIFYLYKKKCKLPSSSVDKIGVNRGHLCGKCCREVCVCGWGSHYFQLSNATIFTHTLH